MQKWQLFIILKQTVHISVTVFSNLAKLMNYIIVGIQNVVQPGGPDPCYNQGRPSKVGARKSFLFTESSRVVSIG